MSSPMHNVISGPFNQFMAARRQMVENVQPYQPITNIPTYAMMNGAQTLPRDYGLLGQLQAPMPGQSQLRAPSVGQVQLNNPFGKGQQP